MKAGYTTACIAIILLFSVPDIAQGTATMHGAAYEWNTFSPLSNRGQFYSVTVYCSEIRILLI